MDASSSRWPGGIGELAYHGSLLSSAHEGLKMLFDWHQPDSFESFDIVLMGVAFKHGQDALDLLELDLCRCQFVFFHCPLRRNGVDTRKPVKVRAQYRGWNDQKPRSLPLIRIM